MKILLTGAGGFIGQNFAKIISESDGMEVLTYHKEMGLGKLEALAMECDVVVHLAGVNRPIREAEFDQGNVGFTSHLVSCLEKRELACPVLFSSSIQAGLDNPYGRSKLRAEELLRGYAEARHTEVYIFRLPNVFGKWCRPNYNSVVATFCYNVARGLPIRVDDPSRELQLVYIDDVVRAFLEALQGHSHPDCGFYKVLKSYTYTVGALAERINDFFACRQTLSVPDMNEEFTAKLYSTYLSYLPEAGFRYRLQSHIDARGSFTEFMRTAGQGQFSVNISKPRIVKGGHWHESKHEKFLVVSGEGVIRLRRIDSSKVLSYHVSGQKLEVVEIPPGYTHEIENIGDTDMVTLMWVNENFNPERPDTYRMEV